MSDQDTTAAVGTDTQCYAYDHVPIDEVRVGDRVEAADPRTGKVTVQRVTRVWVNRDSDLWDVTVAAGGSRSVVHATRHHLFWDDTTHAWTEAHALRAGDRLRTDDGRIATVASTTEVAGAASMWDLTVATTHTFYIVTSGANVLVHNCGRYENPGHHDPIGGPNPYNPKKAVLPGDAEVQFENSVDVNGTRWSKVGEGRSVTYYRYFNDGNDNWHWSGSTSGVTSRGAPVSIPLSQVPISVRRT